MFRSVFFVVESSWLKLQFLFVSTWQEYKRANKKKKRLGEDEPEPKKKKSIVKDTQLQNHNAQRRKEM